MTEEQTNETGKVEDMTQDYITAINQLKQNSVDRSEYDKLRSENKKLLDSIVNGQTLEQTPVVEKADIAALRQAYFKQDQTNLEYCTNALKLRNALIENGETDPFLPFGKKIAPTNSDVEAAERVASVLKECIDYADGDSQLFTNELQRRMVDTGPS